MQKLIISTLALSFVLVSCTQPPTSADPPHPGASPEAISTETETPPADTEDLPADVSQTSPATNSAVLGVQEELAWRHNLPNVIETVMPSVVGIATERTVQQRMNFRSPFDDPRFRQFSPFGPPPGRQPQERTQQGIGSGVIVDASGIVLTNHHVIEGADSILINLSDGRELRADIKGTDPSSDIAVLQIQDPPDDLHAIEFGNSDELRLGESVIAIGNPFGLSGTVTLGIISAKGRANVGLLDYEDFIQTDAAINPGNSGGALINLDGDLVGINTAILSRSGGYQGIGFAIPSNMVEMALESLLETGEVQRGWLGVHIQQLTPEIADGLGVEPNLRGVLISDVQQDSPAEEAGLQRGDVITAINGRPVHSPSALRNTIGLQSPNSEVQVEYHRGNEIHTLRLVLGSLNEFLGAGKKGPDTAPAVSTAIEGLELRSLDRELQQEFNLPGSLRSGVVVTNITPGSDAARLQLRPGDVILEVNRRPVQTPADVSAAYDNNRPQNLFLLYRDGSTIFMAR